MCVVGIGRVSLMRIDGEIGACVILHDLMSTTNLAWLSWDRIP